MPPRKQKRKQSRLREAWMRTWPKLRNALWVFVILAALVWIAWNDVVVRTQFDGRRWALPARVYARPLQIFPGRLLHYTDLLAELDALGYRKVATLSGSGQYVPSTKGVVEIATRGFTFSDAVETPRVVSVRFNGAKVQSLQTQDGKPLALIRIEPLEIGKIYPRHNEDRLLVKSKDVPPALIEAIIAVEDRNYYWHFGIDPKAVLRALWENLRAGAVRQGGSTLTQQLVKNFYLSRERTLARKLNEVLMAVLLEVHYSKEEILEAYLNEIFLGQDGSHAVHGFGLASQFYFGIPLGELRTHQLALLAALARGASHYDPRRYPDRALKRRNLVLQMMVEQEMLSPEEGLKALAMSLDVTKKPRVSGTRFPAFMDLIRRQIVRDYREDDLRSEGLQVFSTLDPVAQLKAERVVSKRVAALEQQRRMKADVLEAALVVTGVENGEVLALVGGRDADYAGFNRALDAKRQIGSIVKPAVYLTALARPAKYSVVTRVNDLPISLRDNTGKVWSPQNYTGSFHGEVPLHVALAQSYNLATVRLGLDLGLFHVRRTLKEIGVDGSIPEYPSVLLGTLDLTPLQVTQMYQTFASGGFLMPIRAIRSVTNADGKALTRYAIVVQQAIEPVPSFLINTLMTDVVRNGTARALSGELSGHLPLAGKTGTTNEMRDSWFAGFDGQQLVVAWLGRDDNKPAGFTGATGAMRVWSDYMREQPAAPLELRAPEGIDWHWIDLNTGFRTDANCPGAQVFPFEERYPPPGYRPCGGIDLPPATNVENGPEVTQ